MKRIFQHQNSRRLFLFIVSLVIAIGLIYSGMALYRTMKYPSGVVLQAIPSNAVMVAEGIGFLEFVKSISENSLWKFAMDSSGQGDPLITVAEQLEGEESFKGSELENLLYQQPYAMALIPKKQNGPSLLYVIRLKEGVPLDQIHASFGKVFTNYKSKRLLEISYFELILPGDRAVYVIAKDGLLLISADREVFELSYYTLESGNHLGKDAMFMDARKQLSKSQNKVPHVLISHEALYGWFRRFLTTQLREVSSVITEVGSWSALELSSLDGAIHLQGFTHILPQRKGYFESMLFGGKNLSDPASVLPFNTFFYDQMAVSGFSDYFQQCIEGYHFRERGDTLSHSIEKRWIDSLSMILREAELRSILVAMTSSSDSGTVGEMLLMMEAARGETAMRGLSIFSDTTQRFIYQEYVINKIKQPGMIPALLGKRYVSFKETWFTNHKNHIILAPGKEALMNVINAMSLGRTLEAVPGYGEGVSQIKGALSRRYYFNASTAEPFLRYQINAEKLKLFDSFVPIMPGQIFLGLTREDGVLLTDMLFYPQFSKAKDDAFREVVLDDVPSAEPALLKDYRSGEMKVLLADRSGNLYSLSYSSGPEWKMTPREAPASALKVIDIYQNGRQQCLFLSKSMLHIVQADGQYVKGYPVSLPVGYESHLTVIDYENNGNYRILYRDVQGKLMNIDIAGKPVAGWTHPAVSMSVRPVSWHRISGLDFLVFTDETGHITAIDRRGKTRFTVQDIRVSEKSEIGVSMLLGQPSLTFLSHEGFLYQLDAQGAAVRHELMKVSPMSQMLALTTINGITDFLIMEPARVSLYDKTLKLLVASESVEMLWQQLQPAKGSKSFLAIGLSHDGVPFVVHNGTAKISRLGNLSFDYSLAWHNRAAGRDEVLLIKGLLARIGALALPER